MSEEQLTPSPEREGNAVFGGQPQKVISEPTWSNIPFEMVPLPSGGSVYPPDSPLNAKNLQEGRIPVKVMTAREEDILTNRAYLKTGKVVEELLKSCMMDDSIDPDDMISGDRSAVMVAIRMIGYGPRYPAEIMCGKCEHEWENDFNLADLEIKRLEIEPVKPGENLFEFVLPVTKHKVIFKFLTGHDEDDMEVASDRRKKLGQRGESRVTDRLRYAIVEYNGSQRPGDIERAINVIPARDSNALRSYMAKHEPGMDMSQMVKCPACGHRQEVMMPIGAKFFYPDPEQGDFS